MDDYSMDELIVRYEAVLRKRSKDIAAYAEAMRMAHFANAQIWTQYKDGLVSLGKRIEDAAAAADTPNDVKMPVSEVFKNLSMMRARKKKHG